MNKERMELLLDIMETVERDHLKFNMNAWITSRSCGTVCCAAGYAALDSRLQEQGLKLACWRVSSGSGRSSKKYITDVDQFINLYNDITTPVPEFDNITGFTALERFFGLNEYQSAYIFSDQDYYPGKHSITPSQVISHIHDVLYNNWEGPF